ncbi:Stk1 family PASTA domain-containing Ser/Thr kinase [Alkalibacter mobilis]|uniref:Stk1 family PASTA domain-containing Ser/Thr kinase n=1 Tax=Alkalibacter mobilis TaxID=2787712 RepID=UPI00189D75FB|nr:Stk1 family PASTA domain-containing Ser/Thr kinase [Alkalibacter mobilis]MBF7095853.1 Stk1 family PASTA domain-containing Ser/Thr kinase [Alkalibacter mobilis]
MEGKKLLNRYQIMELIGQGGMALVYKAKDTLLNRVVAVKVLKSEFNENEQFIKKFKRESQAAASLSHNNIVSVFDVGVEDNNHFIVMEYVEGDTLKEYIQKKGKLSWKETAYISKQIALALDHAHKNKIIHRDIKPHNILITEDLIPKVTDFGIARAITTSTITLVEETMGSVHYISPEQARGGFVDERSDLYSLGIVMFEMLTGRVPLDADNAISVAIKHIQEEIEFHEDDLDDIPESMEELVLKLIKKNPNDRYENAKDLIQDLVAVQNGEKVKNIKSRDKRTRILPGIKPVQKPKSVDADTKKSQNKSNNIYRKPAFWIMASAIAVVVIVGLIFVASIFKVKDVQVPKVEGMEMTEAISLIEEAGLNYEIEKRENHPNIPENHVISQNPASSTYIKESQTVKLTVSEGPREVEVPDVIGKFEVEGIQELENFNFVVKEINRQFNEEIEKDIIYDQNPMPGLVLKEGSEIILYVSKGKDTVIMEDYKGKTVEEAKAAIQAAGLQVGNITEVVSEQFDKGLIIDQNPKSNEEVPRNSVVTLTVSKGKLQTKTINIRIQDYLDIDLDDEEIPTVNLKVVLISQDNGSSVEYEKKHKADETVSVELEGFGVQYYQVEIDGKQFSPEIITF